MTVVMERTVPRVIFDKAIDCLIFMWQWQAPETNTKMPSPAQVESLYENTASSIFLISPQKNKSKLSQGKNPPVRVFIRTNECKC